MNNDWSVGAVNKYPSFPIVFIHIFKAAGTSVQLQIRTQLGIGYIPKINDGLGFFDRIATELEGNSPKVLAGHFQYKRVAEAFRKMGRESPFCFSFVRDPISRVLSSYNYFVGQPNEKWHAEASSMDINEFVRFLVDRDPDAIVNHQCRVLSENAVPTFDNAIENIKQNFAFVGSTDNIALANPYLREFLGVELNVDERRNASYRYGGKSDLTKNSEELLQSVLSEDIKLYQHIKESGSILMAGDLK